MPYNIKGNGAAELFRQVKQDGARFKNANGLDGAIVNQSWIFEFGLRSTNADPNWSPLQVRLADPAANSSSRRIVTLMPFGVPESRAEMAAVRAVIPFDESHLK